MLTYGCRLCHALAYFARRVSDQLLFFEYVLTPQHSYIITFVPCPLNAQVRHAGLDRNS